jgi:hypothetical protein
MTATPKNPDDLLSPEQIEAAGIPLTAGNLQAMIEAARAQDRAEARTVELFPLKPMLPPHVSYETGRKAAASRELPATKLGGDWFVVKRDVEVWLAEKPTRWFESEGDVQKWRTYIAGLEPRWIP